MITLILNNTDFTHLTNPIITITGTFVGLLIVHVYFINIVLKRRERTQQKINDAIKVTEEISLLLNGALACLFWHIREHNNLNLKSCPMTDTNTAIVNAFKFRLRYKILVKTYFQEESIEKDYDNIILQLNALRHSINEYEKGGGESLDTLVKQLNVHIEKSKTEWNISSESKKQKKTEGESERCHTEQPANIPIFYDSDVLPSPYDIYLEWSQIIWIKSQRFTLDLYRQSLNIKN